MNLLDKAVSTSDMRRHLLFILCVLTAPAMVQADYSSFGEAFSLRKGQGSLEVGYRQHTAPSLTEFSEKGVLVDRLEVYPTEIRIAVGGVYSPSQLRVTTYGPDGGIEEHVPLSLDLEGPPGLLDYAAWRTYGNKFVGATAGTGTIWVVSLAPSSTGERLRQPILLIVH